MIGFICGKEDFEKTLHLGLLYLVEFGIVLSLLVQCLYHILTHLLCVLYRHLAIHLVYLRNNLSRLGLGLRLGQRLSQGLQGHKIVKLTIMAPKLLNLSLQL